MLWSAAVVGGCAGPDVASWRGAAPAYSAMHSAAAADEPRLEERAPAAHVQEVAPTAPSAGARVFGDQGSRWWSVQGGASFTQNSTDLNGRLGLHCFVADDFEVNGSVGAWGHLQEEEDEASAGFDLGFRWHFINRARERADGAGMTVYADTGIGMLYATGDVPTDGTRYNFTPRAGVGATWALGDDAARLDLGVRWQHFSNGSTSGSDDNPARDAAMVYVGVIFPF